MEQWRLFLAIVLSIFVFFLWEVFFVSHPPTPPQGPDKPVETQKEPREPAPAEKPAPSGTAVGQKDQAIPEKSFKSVTIESSLYTAKISEKGAALTSFVLKHYREDVGPKAPLQQLIPEANHAGMALVRFLDSEPGKWTNARFTTNYDGDRLAVGQTPQSISFFWESPEGVVIEKQYTFLPKSYRVNLNVVIKNLTDRPITEDLVLTIQNLMDPDRSRFAFEGPFAYMNGELEEIDIGDIEEKDTYSGRIQWAGICDRYFMTVAVPKDADESRFMLAHDPESHMVKVNYLQPVQQIHAGNQDTVHFSLYFGPKRMSTLRQYDDNLEAAINFGFFDIIAKPCLWLMNFIHDHLIANYGVAIILLTILFKIIFWPLGTKSYKSMAEMKKLQPLMADIRKKYKDDKKKMNEEVMRLYKTYKVNPMSGCLPMVVQIPVFIAFYRMLYEAIELRHAPFMLWINDLSAPDRLFQFDINVPLMLPPYGIPVLTIIMGATMFLQQKLSPPPGDPAQAKFMMMMPLVLTVIFINFPAGLVLYWLVNNVISIAQQYYITKKHV
jgi:YidC/Oxa1 family membrane protein insertase